MTAAKERKRFFYCRMATHLRQHERAAKAEKLCPGAMGLYLFLNLQARGEETHGETFEDIAIASWGASNPAMLKYRKKQAAALIEAGLVIREGDDLLVVKYLDHNDGPEEIASNRAAATKRRREADDRKKNGATHVPLTRESRVADASVSVSVSVSDLSESRSPEPAPARDPSPPAIPDAMAAPPDWWESVLATLHASTGVLLPALPSWISYAGHRGDKRKPATRNDALYWLNQVKVPEAKREATDARRQRDRDAVFATSLAERGKPQSGALPGYCAPAADRPEPSAAEQEIAKRDAIARLGASELFPVRAAANDTPKTGTDE